MDKRVTTRLTSPQAASDSSDTSTKNDSFLEDMELISHDSTFHVSGKGAERFITTRNLSPSVAQFQTVREEPDVSIEEKTSNNIAHLKIPPLRKSTRRDISNIDKPHSSADQNSRTGITTAKELNTKIQESKSRSLDNKSKSKPSDTKISENQTKLLINDSNKLHQERKSLPKDRSRRSGSYKDSDQSTEALKENKQPSNLYKQGNSSVETSREHSRRSEGGRKIDSREIPVSGALLGAIEEIVSKYTTDEGIRISNTVNELHLLSQVNLFKNLMYTIDEIRKDLQLGENLGQIKVLMAENERLRENCAILKMKNQDLQRKLEESENIREENDRLKLKLQEFDARKSN